MKYNLIQLIIIAALLSLLVNKITYYGYTSTYSANMYDRAEIRGMFGSDVYKYRILSKYLLFQVDDWLSHFMPEKGARINLLVGDPNASERFYLAIFSVNTFFLILTSVMVVLLLHLPGAFAMSESEKVFMMYFVPLVVGLSTYAIAFYDTSSYFFQLLILYIFLRYADHKYNAAMIAIGILIILSTTNRESSALSVSIISLLLLVRYGITERTLMCVAGLAACFLVTYITLRLVITVTVDHKVINDQIRNFLLDTNLYGILFWMLFGYLPFAVARTKENKCLIRIFLLFSLPYILTCFISGVLWEVRLFVPLLLGSLMLSRLDTSHHILPADQLLHRLFPFHRQSPQRS